MQHKFQRGFTLMEMLLVILILGILVAMSTPLLTQGLNAFSTNRSIIIANWQGQLALERMTRDIMQVRSPADISTIGANTFGFVDFDGNTITYSLSGTNLMLTLNGNAAILASGIQSLAFSYMNDSGSITATASTVRLIKITLDIVQNNVAYTLTTSVYPRNLA